MQDLHISSAVGVHVGKIRKNNEDNFYCKGVYLDENNREDPIIYSSECKEKVQIYAVCDGMGGEQFGELASLLAVKTLKKYEEIINILNEVDIDKYIKMYISEVNNLICEESELNGGKRIGTTIVLLCVNEKYTTIYNVGDSRAYIYRKGKLSQVSVDDTQAQQAIERGLISKEDAKTHPYRNKLTQHLGIKEEELSIKINKTIIKNKKFDKFLLCSDGLYDMVPDEDIENTLRQDKDEKTIVKELIIKALQNGGKDNISVIVISNKTKKKYFISE